MFANRVDERGAFRRFALFTEDAVERVGGLKLAHVEPDHPVGRAEKKLGERFGDFGFARAGRPDEEKDAFRARRVGQSGFDHRDTFDQTFNRFGLAEHAPLKECAEVLKIQARAFIENAHRKPGQLRQCDEQIVERYLAVAASWSAAVSRAAARSVRSRRYVESRKMQ